MNVPFLDVLTALCDKDLPLTSTDHEELGNPIEDQQIYDLISSYCPYENINDKVIIITVTKRNILLFI